MKKTHICPLMTRHTNSVYCQEHECQFWGIEWAGKPYVKDETYHRDLIGKCSAAPNGRAVIYPVNLNLREDDKETPRQTFESSVLPNM